MVVIEYLSGITRVWRKSYKAVISLTKCRDVGHLPSFSLEQRCPWNVNRLARF